MPGLCRARTSSDLIEPTRKAMQQMQQSPLAGCMPYTRQTEGVLRSLADLKPETLAVMHGSSYIGQGTGCSPVWLKQSRKTLIRADGRRRIGDAELADQ